MNKEALKQRILELKKKKNAVILAHNYQRKDIQDIADILGDSLDLSRKAKNLDKDIIVFAGVRFMAETAKILSPSKKVLLPSPDANCEMADMAKREDVIRLRKQYPDAKIVCYVNTYAEVKAECDICCTSRNAKNVVKSLDAKRIVFIPDRNLAHYVQKEVPEKEIIPFDGYCYVHDELINQKDLILQKEMHKNAKIIAHPEAREEVLQMADFVASTNGMLKIIEDMPYDEYIIATEADMTTRLANMFPNKKFYPASKKAICRGMKSITLENIYESLLKEQYEVVLEEDVIKRAQDAILKMIEIS